MTNIYTSKNQPIQVDSEFACIVSDYKWNVDKKGYAKTSIYVRSRNEAGESGLPRCKNVKMHRLIYETVYRVKLNSDDHIDHINRNPSDNRISNLRLSKKGSSINQINVAVRSDNTTGYKGVTFRERTNKYEAKISNAGRRIWIGSYKTAKDASIAYNQKAQELFGSAAYLNGGSI